MKTRLNHPLCIVTAVSALSLFIAGCGKQSVAPCTGATASYASIQAKIIGPSCVSCHGNMSTYSGVTSGRVVAGNPGGSSLYTNVLSGAMPKNGAKLCDADIQAISSWIQSGAANN